jgi:hypothetical protein
MPKCSSIEVDTKFEPDWFQLKSGAKKMGEWGACFLIRLPSLNFPKQLTYTFNNPLFEIFKLPDDFSSKKLWGI